jgi:hypothetical protein
MWIKTPEQRQVLFRHRSGERRTGRDYKNSPTSDFQPANAGHLSSGRCGKLPRCLCSGYVGPLHTTSFRWDYFTLHLSVCQAFDENSFRVVELLMA